MFCDKKINKKKGIILVNWTLYASFIDIKWKLNQSDL